MNGSICQSKTGNIRDLVTFGDQALDELTADFIEAVNNCPDGKVVDISKMVTSLNFATE